jgi:hypothetical protein
VRGNAPVGMNFRGMNVAKESAISTMVEVRSMNCGTRAPRFLRYKYPYSSDAPVPIYNADSCAISWHNTITSITGRKPSDMLKAEDKMPLFFMLVVFLFVYMVVKQKEASISSLTF